MLVIDCYNSPSYLLPIIFKLLTKNKFTRITDIEEDKNKTAYINEEEKQYLVILLSDKTYFRTKNKKVQYNEIKNLGFDYDEVTSLIIE